jgi:hypothetical protein
MLASSQSGEPLPVDQRQAAGIALGDITRGLDNVIRSHDYAPSLGCYLKNLKVALGNLRRIIQGPSPVEPAPSDEASASGEAKP